MGNAMYDDIETDAIINNVFCRVKVTYFYVTPPDPEVGIYSCDYDLQWEVIWCEDGAIDDLYVALTRDEEKQIESDLIEAYEALCESYSYSDDYGFDCGEYAAY
jgi:hypothetical protein